MTTEELHTAILIILVILVVFLVSGCVVLAASSEGLNVGDGRIAQEVSVRDDWGYDDKDYADLSRYDYGSTSTHEDQKNKTWVDYVDSILNRCPQNQEVESCDEVEGMESKCPCADSHWVNASKYDNYYLEDNEGLQYGRMFRTEPENPYPHEKAWFTPDRYDPSTVNPFSTTSQDAFKYNSRKVEPFETPVYKAKCGCSEQKNSKQQLLSFIEDIEDDENMSLDVLSGSRHNFNHPNHHPNMMRSERENDLKKEHQVQKKKVNDIVNELKKKVTDEEKSEGFTWPLGAALTTVERDWDWGDEGFRNEVCREPPNVIKSGSRPKYPDSFLWMPCGCQQGKYKCIQHRLSDLKKKDEPKSEEGLRMQSKHDSNDMMYHPNSYQNLWSDYLEKKLSGEIKTGWDTDMDYHTSYAFAMPCGH